MGDLPSAPSPAPYHERERPTLRGFAVRVAWTAVAWAVLGSLWVAFVGVVPRGGGPTSNPWRVAAWLGVAGATAVVFIRRWARRRPPGTAPWESDRAWRRDGDIRRSIARELPVSTQVTLAFVLVASFAVFVIGIGSLCSVITGALLIGIVLVIARAWIRGGVEVRWDEFPMRTGTRVRFHVATTAGGASMPEFGVVLRCIETREVPGDIDVSTHAAAIIPCITRGPLATGPEEFVTVEFDIPANAPGTDLGRRGQERYWELVVMGTTAWGTIAEAIIVPIYAVGGASARGAVPGGGS
jgi:hypothetical protein